MDRTESNKGLHPTPRWLFCIEWTLFALLAIHLGAHAVPAAWQKLNTDFPNYYVTARLVREHSDVSRVYEWIWLQRQKDHRAVDQRIVGMVPITPVSTLAIYPLAKFPPLEAKHFWLVLNLAFLLISLSLLRSMTNLPWRRLGIVAMLSVPLAINFAFGQFYVLLLLLVTLSCWLYTRQKRFLSGIFVGLAAGLKVFPILYLLYFLRKRDLKAFAGGIVSLMGVAALSVGVFGWQLNRTYLFQVLPAALRGEALDPYNLQLASLGSLLHHLFILEPQLNPHPASNLPWIQAILQPLLQMAIFAPALLLAEPLLAGSKADSPRRLRLEWAAIVLASLAISTSPASYLFTLLILPVCLLLDASLEGKSGWWTAAILAVYTAVGYLHGANSGRDGWLALVGVPRLYALILLMVIAYAFLKEGRFHENVKLDRRPWVFALSLLLLLNIASAYRHQRGLFADYRWRMPLPGRVNLAAVPAADGGDVAFVALLSEGYQVADATPRNIEFSGSSELDYLSLAAANGARWLEQVGDNSVIVPSIGEVAAIREAESPVASFDGRWLAFLREDRGRARLWLHDVKNPNENDRPLTPVALNVLEASFLPTGEVLFAASADPDGPELYLSDRMGRIQPLHIRNARYPAASPDGHWLAYSELVRGSWNLRLRNLDDSKTVPFTDAACNSIQPSWSADSRSLLYASDCGRGLWLTALCKRPVFP